MLVVSIRVAMVTSDGKESPLTHLFVFPFLPLFLLSHPPLAHPLPCPSCPTPPVPSPPSRSSQVTTEKHWMSFPETVDEILDVSEDEGKLLTIIYSAVIILCSDWWFL